MAELDAMFIDSLLTGVMISMGFFAIMISMGFFAIVAINPS